MSEPVISPDRKPPETIKVTARYLESVLDQAHSAANATSYIDVDENGALVRVEDNTTAEAVTRADEVLTQYLREHRAVLGEDQHWRAYYNEFNRADGTTVSDAPPAAKTDNRRSTVVETAKALENRLFELYDIENAPAVRMTEDGPQYYDAEDDNQELTQAITEAEKRWSDYLIEHRAELGNVAQWERFYADLDHREHLVATSADEHQHRVSMSFDDGLTPFDELFRSGRSEDAPDRTTAYITALDIVGALPHPDDRIRIVISREVVGTNGVGVEALHETTGRVAEVTQQVVAWRQADIDAGLAAERLQSNRDAHDGVLYEFDSATVPDARAAEVGVAGGGLLPPPPAPTPGTQRFAFNTVPAAQAAGPATTSRRTR